MIPVVSRQQTGTCPYSGQKKLMSKLKKVHNGYIKSREMTKTRGWREYKGHMVHGSGTGYFNFKYRHNRHTINVPSFLETLHESFHISLE